MRVTGADGRAGCGMTDYISREAVLTALFNGEHNLYSWDEIEDRLSAIPAADVRPVVLCRDCVHARRYTNKIKCGYWSEQTASEIVCEDDFCSRGEKREES